jgi:Flp pilus assembly protein TadD
MTRAGGLALLLLIVVMTPAPAASDRHGGAPSAAAAQATPSPAAPTFADDIAPLVFDACSPCHRTGGPAPFSLATYAEVSARARQIADVTASRFMPPWKVEPAVGNFVGQRPLTDPEIAMLRVWAEAGAPAGPPGKLPVAPSFRDGWLLGKPDLVVTLPASYTLRAEPGDVFRIFSIPIPVSRRVYVRGIEFLPGNHRVVHHANLRVDRTGATRALDAADPLPGYDGLMPRSAEYPDGHFLGWTPGQVAPLVTPDLAWPLEPGTDLVMQLHLQPSGAVEHVRPSIGFYFSDVPPAYTPSVLRLGSQGIDIAPGESQYVVRDDYTLPVDAELLAVQPHAHYRATRITGTATFPDGRSQRVIHIADWDFRWQHVYRLVTPLPLPKHTRLSMEFTYDNSARNIRNPSLPPARVFWGQRSDDEMGDLWLQLLVKSPADRARLNAAIAEKMTAEDIIGYETLLRVTPGDHELHDDVALLYLQSGRAADAVRHFRASVAARPQVASAAYNLGIALAMAGDTEGAIAEFERAVALDATYGIAYANLGAVLMHAGRLEEAVTRLERAVHLMPANVEALNSLSAVYEARGERSRALAVIDRALALSPAPAVERLLRERRTRVSQ